MANAPARIVRSLSLSLSPHRMARMRSLRMLPLFLAGAWSWDLEANAGADRLDRSPSAEEVPYSPEDGAEPGANPPAFVWLPVDGVDRWILQYSRSPDFADDTTTVRDIDLTVFIPTRTLDTGDWYWRYGFVSDGEPVFSRTRRFRVSDEATPFPRLPIEEVLERVPRERPRVYFTPEQVEEIRADDGERYGGITDPVVRQAERVLEAEDDLFPEPDPWDDYDDPRQTYVDTFRAMRPYTRGMEICARAYLFTGDKRFAEEARRRLMHFMTWDVEGPSSVYPPTELGMDIAEHAPRTFDWIYDTLTDEERETCLEVLGRRIAQVNGVHRSRPFEARPYSSHPGRMIGFAVEGSLVLAHEVPEAAEWLDYTLKLLWSVYPAWGGDDGGWHEGISYWGSYMRRITQVVTELDRLGIPLKDKPFFRNTGWFGLYAAYPHRPRRSFGDGHEHAVSRPFGNLMYTLASLYDNPYFRWYAERMGGGPDGPHAMATYRPDLESRPPQDLPASRLFADVGWVALHSRMEEPDENILFLMQASPYGSISHNFANQNAFILEAFREPLAISSGYYHGYGTQHHREWVWQTRAHNSVLVNGEGQDTRSRSARGTILDYGEKGDHAYVTGDATEAYGGRLERFHRHVLFLRPDTVVMVDDLAAPAEAEFQWLLHSPREMNLAEGKGEVEAIHGDAVLRTTFLAPDGLTFRQTTGFDPAPDRPRDGPPQFHFQASTNEPATERRFVTVLQIERAGADGSRPEARLTEADGGLGLAVGDRTILWRETGAATVRGHGRESTERWHVE